MLKTTKFCCKNTKKTFKLNILLNNAQSAQKSATFVNKI